MFTGPAKPMAQSSESTLQGRQPRAPQLFYSALGVPRFSSVLRSLYSLAPLQEFPKPGLTKPCLWEPLDPEGRVLVYKRTM